MICPLKSMVSVLNNMKLAILLTVFLVALVAVVLIDDDLDSEPAEWASLAMENEGSESDAFYFLFGIMAHESEEPVAVGKDLLEDYRKQEEKLTVPYRPLELDGYPESKQLMLPKGDLYCRLAKDSCFEKLVGAVDLITYELEKHSVLLNRYQEFLSYDDFKTLTKPTLYEVLPRYEYLEKGNRLNGFLVIKNISNGQEQAAVDRLYSDIFRVRQLLTKADSFFVKLISASILANDLDLLANLYAGGYIRNASRLPELTMDERSLYRPLIREFGMDVNLYKDIGANPEVFREGGDAPPWIVRAMFKPNMTINSAFSIYYAVYRLSLKSPSEFRREIAAQKVLPETETMFNVRNFLGALVIRAGRRDLTKHIISMHDLDCKIRLVNLVLASDDVYWLLKGHIDGTDPEIRNPYNQEQTAYIDREAKKLCFSGLDKHRKGNPCIRINAKTGSESKYR